MKTWAGKKENVAPAQQAFYRRIKMNSLARDGRWTPELERAA
jgi:fructose-bisphosphate aldolase class I